jgi:type 1 fimbriae regulatory protein FimE
MIPAFASTFQRLGGPMGGSRMLTPATLKNSERDAPMTPAGFRKTLARIGEASELAFPVHPHMLRHACGFKLANDGQDTRALQHYLGHRNIQHTVRYTELTSARFNGFWKD